MRTNINKREKHTKQQTNGSMNELAKPNTYSIDFALVECMAMETVAKRSTV